MKQTIIMIVCIFILVVGGVAEVKYLQKSSRYIMTDMDYIQNAIENDNFELAKEQIEKSYNTWSKIKNIWNMFIVHDEIDDIEQSIIELREYIKFENTEECIVSIAKVKEFLDHTVKRQEVRMDNIL